MYQDKIVHSEEDAMLLRQLSEGSKAAFDVLYDKYWKQVYNAAYKRLNDADQAADIAQDVFVQLWVRGTKSPIDNLPAYLFVASRNSVFKHMEKAGKFMGVPQDAAHELEARHGGADAGMLHKEFLQAFNVLVNSLPTQQQAIFRMRFEEEMSSQEIAEKLQISPKTVRNQMGKALATLKTSMMVFNFLMIYEAMRR
ncbi:putative RNA polymerase ECF sigma factor [Pedobacter sp. BAL39]|uniref:RNA polymerase sigma factor n=1 Tax=Pedobacter sp. BAL39 TaxID=391596 RepID=UPI0001559675|nr:sigma-70 family RNA polymerase sigma factor [Pedobacter sp. BAL39]EDM35419.1 putative RNA polymerase ECF sigma factor [Pedobacter sp. BAL39]